MSRLWGGEFLGILFLLSSCGHRQVLPSVVLADTVSWRSGDLIFRTGNSMESHFVLRADKSGFSHVGMLVRTQRGWQVVHATTGEDEDNIDTVKSEPVAHFIQSCRCVKFKVARVSCSNALAKEAAHFIMKQIGKPFDDDFSLTDTTKYYCTELVWQAYRQHGIDLSNGHRHQISLLGFRKTCLLPEDIISSPICKDLNAPVK